MTEEEFSLRNHDYGVRLSLLEQGLKNAEKQLERYIVDADRRLSEIYRAHSENVFKACKDFDGYVVENNAWRDTVITKLAVIAGRAGGIGWALEQMKWFLPTLISLVGVAWIVMHTG